MSDPVFIHNPLILVHPDRIQEFFPTGDQTLFEKINAVMRLLLYTTVVLSVYQQSFQPVMYLVVTTSVIIVLFLVSKYNNEPFSARAPLHPHSQVPKCADKKGCSGEEIDSSNHNPNRSQFLSNEDRFSDLQMERIMAVSESQEFPNDRESFQNYLFKDYPNCKTNPNECHVMTDLRVNRDIVNLDVDPIEM